MGSPPEPQDAALDDARSQAAARAAAGNARFRVVAGVLLVLFAGYAAVFIDITAHRLSLHPAGSDFFALWSTAKFAASHTPADAYDAARLRAALLAQGMSAASDYPFPYPPFFLFVLCPLGRLPFAAAYLAAMSVSLAGYLWATVGRDWRSPAMLAALLAPSTTIALVAGQAGLLAAALLVGGCRAIGRRPVLAGVLFGLLSFKPQLGLLVPVALLAAREWRAIAAALGTITGLAAASTGVFGAGVWSAWAHAMIPYADEFASAAAGGLDHLMPTVTAAARSLGAPARIADLAQLLAAALAACVVWRTFRSGSGRRAAPALFAATFLATPHAFVYDMPPVTTAVLWLLVAPRPAAAPVAADEALVMIAALLVPVALVTGTAAGPPLAVLALALLLAVSARRSRQGQQPPAAPPRVLRRAAAPP